MTIHSVSFVHPAFLIVGLACAAMIIALGVRLDRQRRHALAPFGTRRRGAASSLSRPLRFFKRGLLVMAVLLGGAAMARPQRGFRWEETHRQGIDLLFAIDTSKSMLAPDLKPNRLTRAKLAVRDLVDKFEGNRVGLVAFAGDAFLQCPLTLDRAMFDQTLDAVDTNLIARGGTDVGRAIEVSAAALQNEPANRKLLVLLTDGEDLEKHALEAAQAAGKAGVRIFTVGVGTHGGELIPVAGAPGTFMHDESGAFVRAPLDESGLRAIAAATGGDYRSLGADGRGLEALYGDVLAKLPRESLGSRMHQVPLERYQWPLALAILCFAGEPLVRERRRSAATSVEPPMRGPKFAVFRHRAASAVALGIAALAARSAHASPRSAERAYHDGKYAEATNDYEHEVAGKPSDPKLQFNLGAAAYKSGDYTKAGAALDHALHAAPVELQQNAYYDLGNTEYRAGQQTVEKEPSQTIEAWKKAIGSYEAAIKLDAKDADAIYNRDLVKRKLAELEKQQQQKKNDEKKHQQAQNDKQKQSAGGKGQPKPEQQGQPKPGVNTGSPSRINRGSRRKGSRRRSLARGSRSKTRRINRASRSRSNRARTASVRLKRPSRRRAPRRRTKIPASRRSPASSRARTRRRFSTRCVGMSG